MFLNESFIDNGGMMSMTVDGYSDENFLYHPGFIGGTWVKDLFQPKKAENDRYNDEYAEQKANCDYAPDDSCADLQDCKNYFQNIINNNGGNSRVPKRKRKAAKNHMDKVNGYIAARECDGATSGIDEAQNQVIVYEKELEELKYQREQDRLQSEKEFSQMMEMNRLQSERDKKMMMYVGLGLAGVVVVSLITRK